MAVKPHAVFIDKRTTEVFSLLEDAARCGGSKVKTYMCVYEYVLAVGELGLSIVLRKWKMSCVVKRLIAAIIFQFMMNHYIQFRRFMSNHNKILSTDSRSLYYFAQKRRLHQ